jgi:hypothetical protein
MKMHFPVAIRGAMLGAALLLTVPGSAHAVWLTPSAAGSVTLVGAGDISICGSNTRDSATALLVNGILSASSSAIAFTAGDSVYPTGSASWYAACYQPTWGAFKSRTRPVPGNHDYYGSSTASGYFGYFGAQAGPSGRGWYRYDAGAWRIYALTSECVRGSRCYVRQYRWLAADLANYPHQCVLAMWHRPRFSSSAGHGSSTRMAPVFKLLYNRGAEIVLSGHDHDYERFAPTDPTGSPAPATGLRQWVVGTGGAALYGFSAALPASQVRDSSSHGVLRLDLRAGGYDWQFIPVAGDSFTDSGSGTCH